MLTSNNDQRAADPNRYVLHLPTRLAQVLLLFVVIVSYSNVFASTCVRRGGEDWIAQMANNHHTIFIGEITAIEYKCHKDFPCGEADRFSLGEGAAHFHVTKAFKGDTFNEVTIYFSSGLSGSPSFSKGRTYLVYANMHESKFRVSMCTISAKHGDNFSLTYVDHLEKLKQAIGKHGRT